MSRKACHMENALVTSATLKLPTNLSIGKSIIHLEQDEPAIQDFIDGMTAGHLAYMVDGNKAHLFDTDLILLVVQRQKTLQASPAFNTGFIAGYLSTLVRKGVYQLTNSSYCEGHHEGLQAYCLLGHRHVFTLSELCSLLMWKHREQNSAFNAGYVMGFIQGLTAGIRATLVLAREDNEQPA
jgi:hypothetical protein